MEFGDLVSAGAGNPVLGLSTVRVGRREGNGCFPFIDCTALYAYHKFGTTNLMEFQSDNLPGVHFLRPEIRISINFYNRNGPRKKIRWVSGILVYAD